MNKAIYIFFLFIFFSCSTEEETSICYPLEQCSAQFWIDPLVSPGVYEDENGYWHIEHQGYNYFTIKGELDELHPDYVINDVPLIVSLKAESLKGLRADTLPFCPTPTNACNNLLSAIVSIYPDGSLRLA